MTNITMLNSFIIILKGEKKMKNKTKAHKNKKPQTEAC